MLPVTLWACVCVWPLDQEDYILIVIQQGPTAPLDSSQSYRSSSPIQRQQKAFSCCLAFSLGQVLIVRPHNCLTVSVYSPFCPLFPVPLADPAVRPIPAEMTCDMSELGVTSLCIWQSSERLWLASGKKKKKQNSKKAYRQMFVPHVLSRFAVKGDAALAELKMHEQIGVRTSSCRFHCYSSGGFLVTSAPFPGNQAICSLA